jgi:OOP family OmpA-OmpF porin
MKTRTATLLIAWTLALAVAGCARGPRAPVHDFTPVNLNPLVDSGEYVQKTNSFLVILDASGTMYGSFGDHRKIDLAKGIVHRMNRTVPDVQLVAGLRTVGQNFSDGSDLVYGMSRYSAEGLEQAVDPVTGGGMTPLAYAIGASKGDLQQAPGNLALIVVSDGKETDSSSVASAEALQDAFGDRICIYTVTVGDDPAGARLMDRVAGASRCGFSTNAMDIASSEDMANFVRRVFLAEAPEAAPVDSDGDGVYDDQDRCPGTPQGVEVDETGCPLDSDGDGVYDYMDQCSGPPRGVAVDEPGCPLDSDGDGVYNRMDECPRTPEGAHVDDRGCWVLEGLYFDTDEAEIKARGYAILQEVVEVLERNPGVRVEIAGHTDSRGSDGYNQLLSERRAQAVRDFLVEAGIDADRLTARGYGESRPAVPNTSDENMAKNRRVQLNPIY